MMAEMEKGFQVDEFCLNSLKAAKKAFDCVGKQDPKKTGKLKRKASDGQQVAQLNAAKAIWTQVLRLYTRNEQVKKDGFQNAYTLSGSKGFEKFQDDIRRVVFASIDKGEDLGTMEERANWKVEFDKGQGWIQNIAQDMSHHIWDNLENNLNEPDRGDILGLSATWPYKKELLGKWSKELLMARRDSNVRYANKVMQVGPINIQSAKGGVRPSRCVPNVRSLHFLRPKQVKNADKVGKGIQGEVFTCHIEECPLIPPNVLLVAKRFNKGSTRKRRADALQEVLMGGLNHRGVVGALGMTTEDPPNLIYDFYNGGDLGNFMDRCRLWRHDKGKTKLEPADTKFVQEKKLMMENRLGIAMALLETMQFLHDNERLHCDLHFANILLHFDYEEDRLTKIYVGICDFGLSKAFSQCPLKEHRIFTTLPVDIKAVRKQYRNWLRSLLGKIQQCTAKIQMCT